jgi:hypothetical protein
VKTSKPKAQAPAPPTYPTAANRPDRIAKIIRADEQATLSQFAPVGLNQVIKDSAKGSIAALPVWWRGYRLRSRLEGRWACFLDNLGIEFEYEPQGFRLPDGVCYLPDFRLPVAQSYAEVKLFDPTEEERRKCEMTVMGTGGTFLYLAGTPDFRAYHGVSLDSGDLTSETYSFDIHANPKAYFEERRFWSAPSFEEMSEEFCSERYREAVYAARGARFDGKDLPKSGHEPFNLSDRELWEGR